MKQISDALKTHLAQEVTTIATGWRVTLRDGRVYGWVDHDQDVMIDGLTYTAAAGLRPTSVRSSADLSVDTLDVSIFMQAGYETEILAGYWDDAEVVVFEYNWSAPPSTLGADALLLRVGHLGELTRANGLLSAEIRGLTQRLTTRIGRAYAPTCPWRHGLWDRASHQYVSSVECGIDAPGWTRAGLITAVDPQAILACTDDTQGEPDGFFNEGLLTFLSGDNTDVTREIRRWSNKLFELYRPFPFPIQVGDAYQALAGDDKTHTTCRGKFNNLVHFGGFPYLPGQAQVFAAPTKPG